MEDLQTSSGCENLEKAEKEHNFTKVGKLKIAQLR